MSGKGDTYRPVNKQKYDENYDLIFRKKENTSKCKCKNESKCMCNNGCKCKRKYNI